MNPYDFAITSRSQFLTEQSDYAAQKFSFAYTMTIQNVGVVAAQLISRYWEVIDGNGNMQKVHGLGVGILAHQPLLRGQEKFEYTSWTTIPTWIGSMRGYYFFVAEDGARFEIAIPEFTLAMTEALH